MCLAMRAMIIGYCKEGYVEFGRVLFDEIKCKDLISFNAMISGYAQNGYGEEALSLFIDTLRTGMQADHFTLVSVLIACSTLASLMTGRQIHLNIIKNECRKYVSVCNALITAYSKCGSILDSESVFSHLKNPDLVTFNTTVSAFAQHGVYRKSVACLVNISSRAGHVKKSYEIIRGMPFVADFGIWDALLSGYCPYSNVDIGELDAEKLMELDLENLGACVSLSNIYDEEVLWKDVKRVRNLMKEDKAKK